ncbi:MAG: methyl-accepting chemotaxis protein [Thiotrichales bacterium]
MHSTPETTRHGATSHASAGVAFEPRPKLASGWLHRLSLPGRFALLLSALLMPLLMFGTLSAQARWHQIKATEQELSGVPYLNAIRQLTEHLPPHRKLTRDNLEKVTGAAQQLQAKRQQLVAIIATLESLDATPRSLLTGNTSWQGFREKWNALTAADGRLNLADTIRLHDEVINHATSILNGVADRSGLILNPNLDSARLINLALNELPASIDKTTQLRRTALRLAERNESTELERIQLSTLLHEATQLRQRIRADIDSAVGANPPLQARLAREFDALEQSGKRLDLNLRTAFLQSPAIAAQSGEAVQLSNEVSKQLYALYDAVLTNLEELIQLRRQHNFNLLAFELGVLFVAVALSLFLYRRITRSILDPLATVRRTMTAIANGDFTRVVESDCIGEFGKLTCDVNATVKRLTETITRIRAAAEEVKNGSAEIAQANLDLSQRTEEQASNLQISASNIAQLTQSVRTSASTAERANRLAAETRSRAELGGESVHRAVTAMSQITASSEKMENIIGAIDDLAFQTNLLALNAAVEAARAGDQGRGFAVVASEVRTLAQRSAAAAGEIKALIEDSRAKVANGTQLVNDSGHTLTGIIDSVREVGALIAEISRATAEQLDGIEASTAAIRQIDDATQQNAALVEQTAAASRSLGDQARNVTDLVAFFRVSIHEDAGHIVNHAPPESRAPNRIERRKADRPWSHPPKHQPKPAVATNERSHSAKVGGGWEAF